MPVVVSVGLQCHPSSLVLFILFPLLGSLVSPIHGPWPFPCSLCSTCWSHPSIVLGYEILALVGSGCGIPVMYVLPPLIYVQSFAAEAASLSVYGIRIPGESAGESVGGGDGVATGSADSLFGETLTEVSAKGAAMATALGTAIKEESQQLSEISAKLHLPPSSGATHVPPAHALGWWSTTGLPLLVCACGLVVGAIGVALAILS